MKRWDVRHIKLGWLTLDIYARKRETPLLYDPEAAAAWAQLREVTLRELHIYELCDWLDDLLVRFERWRGKR